LLFNIREINQGNAFASKDFVIEEQEAVFNFLFLISP